VLPEHPAFDEVGHAGSVAATGDGNVDLDTTMAPTTVGAIVIYCGVDVPVASRRKAQRGSSRTVFREGK
jgi:hypothetical protein